MANSLSDKEPISDQQVDATFKKMMQRCKLERKANTSTTIRGIAGELGKTENYVSSIENGREYPSLKTFIKYLLVTGFDPSPLCNLSIADSKDNPRASDTRDSLVKTIYSLNEDQIEFLVEQAKLTEVFGVKTRKAK